MKTKEGGFTIPGQSNYEQLTLELAKRWGADVIRDSDGTDLSKDILDAGFDIYSTICIIREHNEWAKENPGHLQQSFLISDPIIAEDKTCKIDLLSGFFREQFAVNETEESIQNWQVFDRTNGREVPKSLWSYKDGQVLIEESVPYHTYTVNFLAWRIWEEISMYNHTTNDWGDKEHLIPLDPIYPAVQDYMLDWLREWCEQHPRTDVVRFTSFFYNFVWIWGESQNHRNRFTDWASYDFTVSPKALDLFEEEYGYRLTSEDFINGGKLQVTHMPPTKAKLDWMAFIQKFVYQFAKALIDLVHEYGKKAYVFYDDSWVGVEPYGEYFKDYGLDGLIKCVFNGFEVRLCNEAAGEMTRELRLHPYLFPTGLGGLPTFAKGGDPTRDAQLYWRNIRRALLRKPVDRIGLGGYLSLTNDYPDFVDCIEEIADEFRLIRELHQYAPVETSSKRVAIVHSWGKLRSWTLSGHFHESDQHPLIHIIESLSGLPFEVDFLSFDDVLDGQLKDVDVCINAGFTGSAWSGGEAWANPKLVSTITKWVYEGGVLLGVDEPSGLAGGANHFRLANLFGIDLDTGAKVNHGRINFTIEDASMKQLPTGIKVKGNIYLLDEDTSVYLEEDGKPLLSKKQVGKGKAWYLTDFVYNNTNTAFLKELIEDGRTQAYQTDNVHVVSARFADRLILSNQTAEKQRCRIEGLTDELYELEGNELRLIQI